MQVQALINLALRKIGRLGSGKAPTPQESADALELLVSLYRRWRTEGAFGEIKDVVPTGDYTVGENEHVFRSSQSSQTNSVNLPELVPDNAIVTDYGQESVSTSLRPPRDGCVAIITDGATSQTIDFIYDGTLKLWQALELLELTDQAPLSHRDANGLASTLAIELADQFGAQVSEITVRAAIRYQQGLTHNYARPMAAKPPSYI